VNLYEDKGIHLGFCTDETGKDLPVRYTGKKHLITIGPNGSGKGVSLIVPNVATLPRSMLVIDPKGEVAAITAKKRAQFGKVVMLNPFQLLVDGGARPYMKSDGFNPLAALDPDSLYFPDDANGIADALIKVEGSDPHWAKSAQSLFSALVMYECIKAKEEGRAPSLVNTHDMLTQPYMRNSEGKPVGLLKTLIEMQAVPYAPLLAKIGRFLESTRETQSIHSSAINQLEFLSSPAIADDLTPRGGRAFSFADMRREITTVYLILPAYFLTSHSGWLRLIIVSALRALMRDIGDGSLASVLFLLDEFAQLGHLQPIEDAMGISRGYGIQLWPILQDLNQLKDLYDKRWQTFLGARGALTAFRAQDHFTATELSKLTGEKTEMIENYSEGRDGRQQRNWSLRALPLVPPQELLTLDADKTLAFVDPLAMPFMAKMTPYYKLPMAAGLDANPYFKG
jgi:type IV secretion system protein VirD4